MKWTPDTCGCQFDVKPDWSEGKPLRKCLAHAEFTDDVVFYEVVSENRRKNLAIDALSDYELIPVTLVAVNRVKDAVKNLRGVSAKLVAEPLSTALSLGNPKAQKAIKDFVEAGIEPDISFRYTADRTCEIVLKGFNLDASDLTAFQGLITAKGFQKVRVVGE